MKIWRFWLLLGIARLAAADPAGADQRLPPSAGQFVRNPRSDNLAGLVLCGYQGWFNAPGDGMGRGFYHYQSDGQFAPGHCGVDYWPGVGELPADKRYDTTFVRPDGSRAQVYSAADFAAADLHFKWMSQYHIDGVFLQRFLSEVATVSGAENSNRVLDNVRLAANRHGRVWALMYDVSNCENLAVFERDIACLLESFELGGDPAYLRCHGRPVIGLWGLFADRPGSVKLFPAMMQILRQKGFYLLLGVDSHWRTAAGPAADRVREIISSADAVSPWSVGRYDAPAMAGYYRDRIAGDQQYLADKKIDFLPVIFPGFSWYNLKQKEYDHIPRDGGRFYRRQFDLLRGLGIQSVYVAMFDEMDEGTCIFKVDPMPPSVDGSRFLTYPDDLYLQLTGEMSLELKRAVTN